MELEMATLELARPDEDGGPVEETEADNSVEDAIPDESDVEGLSLEDMATREDSYEDEGVPLEE